MCRVRVQVGIDAAVTANHHIAVRVTDAGRAVGTRAVRGPPTLTGLAALSGGCRAYPGAVAVVEPTSMTWLSLAVALADSERGCACLVLGTPRGCGARSR